MHFSNEILRQLGPEYEYQPGSWFLISSEDVLEEKSGRQFSNKRARPVVLANSLGPGVTLYPRSTSGGCFRHRAHRHGRDEPRCKIDRDGRVVLQVPVTVDSSLLDETSFSCAEPEDTGLLEAIRRAIGAER